MDRSRQSRGLRVLVCAESFLPASNGVTNSVVRLLQHLDRHDHHIHVIAPGPGRTSFELASGREIPVTRVWGAHLPRYRSLSVGLTTERAIRAQIAAWRPDVVHLAAPAVLGNPVGAAASRSGVRSVAVFQTDLPSFAAEYGLGVLAEPLWSWLRHVHNRSDLTLAPTSTIASRLRSRGFARVKVWGRGVDHEQFTPSRRSAELRRRWGADDQPGSPVLVGYVGRLAPEKRIDRLRALANDPLYRLVVVGDGPAQDRLEQQLPNATFTGHLHGTELGRAMASLDVFVHTGEHETFCQTIQEAMASGVAVVAPSAGGPIDLVDHRVDGLLYRPDNAGELESFVRKLAVNTALRRSLAAEGQRRVATRTWEAVGDELLEHYGAIAVESRRAA